jgi:mono/diheme cytochrome c family protein
MKMRALIALVFVYALGNCGLAQDKVDFQTQIQPIFVEHCIKCHGEKQASGKMRLHTAANLKEKWDADKELLVAGEPEKSELYQRITLPADDKKRMPRMADPLPKEKIDLIAAWIKQGAVLPEGAAAPATNEKPAEAAAEEKPAEIPLPEVSAAPKEAIDKLTAAGAQVMPLFAESSLLTVSFAHRTEPAGDAEISLLSGVAEQVYALNLADSMPTDAGLAPLAGLKNLATLHLERSSATDAGLVHIAGLANLQYLNLYGTAITDEGLKHLAGLKHLQRLYLWQTKVSYETAMSMEKDTPGLIVNLGYDHPMVVKTRLTKELEQVKKQVEEAKAEEAKLTQQLEGAKKNAEAVTARQAEIEKQLKELEAPAATAAASAAEATTDKPAEDAKPAEEAKPAEAEKPAEAKEEKPADEAKPEAEKAADEAKPEAAEAPK